MNVLTKSETFSMLPRWCLGTYIEIARVTDGIKMGQRDYYNPNGAHHHRFSDPDVTLI